MPLSLQVIYPIADGTHFDWDHYLGAHDALVAEYMGPYLSSTQVTKGVSDGPDAPPSIYAVFTAIFPDQPARDAALKASGPVLADIPNFTNTTPQMLFGEVMA